MQLLNSLHSQLAALPARLQTSLEDIVNQIEIQSYYAIKHPHYEPVEIPETVIPRFQLLPVETQSKHLGLQLRNFLYGAYYNGSLLPINSDGEQEKLTNNSVLGVDIALYENLHKSNQSQGYWSYHWLVVAEEKGGNLLVQKSGLTLYVEPFFYQSSVEKDVKVGELINIKLPKNLVQNGFYMAIANAGSQGDQDVVRIYFNLTPKGAVAVMENLTSQLNYLSIPFSFKALYNPDDYRRYDSAVLYFNKHNCKLVWPVLARVYTENQAYFCDQVPLFTKQLAPGLACAEEPDIKFGEKESFGTNRCQIIANGLVSAWEKGNHSSTEKMAAILHQFNLHRIELQRPYLNADSEDIYTPL
ncbi:MAG TPA: T3SS effector HopA1 family protein [Nostocaceae cyanobacterium]|nr:T3SS effector HopA1 family protein [Nostocaceae cyanobacterium]